MDALPLLLHLLLQIARVGDEDLVYAAWGEEVEKEAKMRQESCFVLLRSWLSQLSPAPPALRKEGSEKGCRLHRW